MKNQGTQKHYRLECVLAPAFKLLEVVFELMIPLLVANIIDKGIAAQDTPYIVRQAVWMAVLGLVGFTCTLFAQYFAAKAAVGIAKGLRARLFSHIQTLSFSNLDTVGTSTLMTRLTNDVNQVQTGWNLALRLLLRSPCVVFGAMIMAFSIDRNISLIFLAMIAALSLVVFGIMLLSIPRYEQTQKKLDGVMDSVRQNLTGVRVMRAFCREDEECEEFAHRTDALYRMQNRVGRLSALMNPLTYLLVNGAVMLLLYQSGVRVNVGTLTAGQTVALYNYLTQILIELVKLADLIITITKAVAGYRRIDAVLQLQNRETTVQTNAPALDSDTVLAFDRVSFTYQNAMSPAINNVTFALKKGQTMGIVGGTGSGKSTLIHLISRFYDASEGTVTFGGQNVKSLSQTELRKKIGLVMQKPVLFAGTIRQNLQMGNPDATEEELIEALKIAQAWDFVQEKDGKLDAEVRAGGKNFSGGQRQRLTIARALAMQGDLLILDDSTSALDYATDAALRQAIAEMENRPATVIVSQRTVAIADADVILVLENGNPVGLGTHDTLLATCPLYREIHQSQYGTQEVMA